MWNLLKAEEIKIRRCSILLVGIVALGLCPLVQYGSQLVMAPEYREPIYDFPLLFQNVVWGNAQIFLPISLVMIGGWLIDRESAQDTLKNIVTIPVPMPKLLTAKLLLTGILAFLFGIYSAAITLIVGKAVGLPGLDMHTAIHCCTQVVMAAMTTYLVCLPLILLFGMIRGAFLGGSILTFFLGYSMMFFKGGALASLYPFSAALILTGFNMSEYAGTKTKPHLLLAAAGVGSMVLFAALLLVLSGRKQELKGNPHSKKKGSPPHRKKGR